VHNFFCFTHIIHTDAYVMKHKLNKRSIASKHSQRRRSSTSSAGAIFNPSELSTKKVDLGIGTVHLDLHAPCLKSTSITKSQKILKRDLLRCNDQRPSLLGAQTLQPPRVHHGSQPIHTNNSSMSIDRAQPVRRRSLSVNSRTFYATIDRIGPWPDVSISRLRSDGNELLRPLKNFRNTKNPRVFSPKYYTAMTENTTKFKFFSQTRNYIDQYRKQKGYILDPRIDVQPIPPPFSVPQPIEDERASITTGDFSFGSIDANNGIARDRANRSTYDLTEHINMSTTPSIPSTSKISVDVQHANHLPTVPLRNGFLRSTRHTSQQPSVILPSLAASSLNYLSSINSVEKAYSNSKNKPSLYPPSKFFLVDNRHKRR